jgi:integrase
MLTIDGKRRTLYAKTRKEVQDKKAALEAAVIKGSYAEPSKTLFGDWMLTWLETYSKPVTEDTTQENYERVIRHV